MLLSRLSGDASATKSAAFSSQTSSGPGATISPIRTGIMKKRSSGTTAKNPMSVTPVKTAAEVLRRKTTEASSARFARKMRKAPSVQ